MISRVRYRQRHRRSTYDRRPPLYFSKTSQISKPRSAPHSLQISNLPVPRNTSQLPKIPLKTCPPFIAAVCPRPGQSQPRPRLPRRDGSNPSRSNNRSRLTSHNLKRNSRSNRFPNPSPYGSISSLKIPSHAAVINLILVM